MTGLLRVQGAAIVDGSGERVRLKGTNVGGWSRFTRRNTRLSKMLTGFGAAWSRVRSVSGEAYE